MMTFPDKIIIQRFQINFLCYISNNLISNTSSYNLPEKSTTVILLTSETHHLWRSRVQLTCHAPWKSPLHVQNCKSPLKMWQNVRVERLQCLSSFAVHTKSLVIIVINHIFFYWKLMHRLKQLPTCRFQMFSLSLEILSTVWPISAMSMLSSRM